MFINNMLGSSVYNIIKSTIKQNQSTLVIINKINKMGKRNIAYHHALEVIEVHQGVSNYQRGKNQHIKFFINF